MGVWFSRARAHLPSGDSGDAAAFAEADGGRAIRLADVDGIFWSAAFAGFLKRICLPSGERPAGHGPVEPHPQVALFGLAGREADHAGAIVAAGQENGAVAAYIEQGQFSGDACEQADISGKVHGKQRAVASGAGGAEPDFIAFRRPSEALNTVPTFGERFLFSCRDQRWRPSRRRRGAEDDQ